MTTIEIVSAAFVLDGRVLVAQRKPTGSHPYKWVTPGGKIEPGETWTDALHRELREEIGLCGQGELPSTNAKWWQDLAASWREIYVHEGISTTTGAPYRVRCFATEVELDTSLLYPGDGIIGLGWFTAEEIDGLSLGPADEANKKALMGLVRPREEWSGDVTPRVGGELFRCDCQCNVFRRKLSDPSVFKCNGCGALYHGERRR